ncbi:hypothetical protein DP939_27110 [Spongiactinospora rosea]|uniref:NACHT domain-containing protein n=1 Tax=Spongiactinospora rosea TaxID=2248750 RepID=A0A366LTA8_9ACTN|nr:NACHT domain-containing protein [Spongiactinospora rosea]RBQ17148.1 hypothetical protein DP939_27110 [Spongiactinospora rosea]
MGRRSTQRAILAALAIASLAAIVIVLTRALKADAKATVNDLVILGVAIIPWTVAIIAWARRPPAAPINVNAAADDLASLVKEQWRAEARHRRLNDPKPIPVPWRMAENLESTSRSHLIGPDFSAFTGHSDDVPGLIGFFRELGQRRLIIIGDPGTGKTTLAMQLLLGLLDIRAEHKQSARPDEIVPVPVLIPISGWDTKIHPYLQDWLAVRLAHDYPALATAAHGKGVFARLVREGHILPVLDGLDEIEESASAEVIRRLNASLDTNAQLILTSRRAEWERAIASAGRPLNAGATIAPLVLSQPAGASYLGDCLAASPPETWKRVLAALGDDTAPRLTALDLWLIRTVYVDTGKDPGLLLELLASNRAPAELRAHLLNELIPSLIETRSPSTDPADHFRPSRRLDPSTTLRYLTFLARRFPPPGDITWWRLARTSRGFPLKVGVAIFLCSVPVFCVTGGIAGVLWAGLAGSSILDSLLAGLLAGAQLGSPLGMAFGAAAAIAAISRPKERTPASRPRVWARKVARGLLPGAAAEATVGVWGWAVTESPEWFLYGLISAFAIGAVATDSWGDDLPGYMGFRLRRRSKTRSLPRELLRGVGFGVLLGSLCGLLFGLPFGVELGLLYAFLGGIMFGVAFGPVIGLIRWTERPLADEVSTPQSSHRADRHLTFLRVIMTATLFGLTIGAAVAVPMSLVLSMFSDVDYVSGSAIGPAIGFGFGFGFAIGFGFGWLFGLVAGKHHAWLALTFTVVPLALVGKLPWRFMSFLDDAHRLGLLRAVGPVYQFRHAALHDHLARGAHPLSPRRDVTRAIA